MASRLSIFCALCLLSSTRIASADIITLKDGRVLEGDVIVDDGKVVKLKMRKATLTFDKKEVVGIVEKPTAGQEYVLRKAKLPEKDAQANLDLGLWCVSVTLEEEAISHFLAAHGLDASLKTAAGELEKRDYHLVNGAWQDPNVWYAAKGWKKLIDKWYHPLEYNWKLCEQDVVKANASVSEGQKSLSNAQAAAERAASQVDAENAKLVGYGSDLTSADRALADLNTVLSKATTKRIAEKAATDSAEDSYKASGGSLSGLAALRQQRRDLSAAQATELKAQNAVTAQEKNISSINASSATSQSRVRTLQELAGKANANVMQLQAQAPANEAELARLQARADAAHAAWDNRPK